MIFINMRTIKLLFLLPKETWEHMYEKIQTNKDVKNYLKFFFTIKFRQLIQVLRINRKLLNLLNYEVF